MPIPFADNVAGAPEIPVILSRRPSSSFTLDSHHGVQRDQPGKGRVFTSEELGALKPTALPHAPVSEMSRPAQKEVEQTVQSISSQGSNPSRTKEIMDEERGEVMIEPKIEGQVLGGEQPDQVHYKTMTWVHAGIGNLTSSTVFSACLC